MKRLLAFAAAATLVACGDSEPAVLAPEAPEDAELAVPVGDPILVRPGQSRVRFTFQDPAGDRQLTTASAVVTLGPGSAVTSVDATADFEDAAALYGNPYVENGLAFSRSGLSFNNNGCGYAGCAYHPGFYPGFTGNYLYGVGQGGYFAIAAPAGTYFSGLEFRSGSGCSYRAEGVAWEAYRDGVLVGAGQETVGIHGTPVLGVSDPAGFDLVRYTRACDLAVNFSTTFNAPALDQVSAQFAVLDPTTKADCKDGGWEKYGFKNQGQCVRFVETGKDSR